MWYMSSFLCVGVALCLHEIICPRPFDQSHILTIARHIGCLRTVWMHACRQKLAAQARERLYGDLQGYSTLLIEPGFSVHALHVWQADLAAGEASWREVACIPLAEP